MMRRSDKNVWRLTALASAMHFLVDGVCVCCLYQLTFPFSIPHLLAIFMAYNVLAFLTQPLTGWVADRLRHRHWMLFVSVLLLGLAVLSSAVIASIASLQGSAVAMFAVASLLGIGNSLFHVWGGKETAVKTGNDMRALGVFVATGVMGLTIGFLYYSWMLLILLLLLVCMLAAGYVWLDTTPLDDRRRPAGHPRQGWLLAALALLLIMAVVMLRSFVGSVLSAGMMRGEQIALLVGLTAMLGKMAGGWLARWMGLVVALGVMVAVVVACVVLKTASPVVPFIGLFAVNCTMPITLYLANLVLPGREGLAFGLLAAALMPGYLLS